jgi:uncharacterized protein
MIQAGKLNTMRVLKILDFGIYLDGQDLGEILMPTKWVPAGTQVDDEIEAFIYFDSEDRPIATTIMPKAMVGEFAYLRANEVNQVGAFLDWGLDKELLVPFKEQNAKMIKGRYYLVYLYLDPRSKRIAASARLERFLDSEPTQYEPGQQVGLIVWLQSDMGYKAIINNKHQGILYQNEIFQDIHTGQRLTGFINKVRPDGKIDLILEKPGYEKIEDLSGYVLNVLKAHGGHMDYNDKSPADEIYSVFQMSKKNFKKSIGSLYKQKLITIEKDGIRLV